MSLPYPTDPSLPSNPTPLFSDATAARGDHLRANNAEIWANFTEIVETMLGNASLSTDGTFAALSDLLFPSQKAVDTYLRSVVYSILPVLGATLKLERTYTPISASNPWFCLSLPDQNWTTTNYSSEFISEMRTRKVIYDELGASPVSSFGGAWSGDTFTLADNATNIAMITALAREYLYAGSPISGWRLLHDGKNEFNIIAISVSARTIKVNLDSKTAAGSAIEIYRHRVYGSTTSARHFSEAGLGFYQAGGDKISGLRRLDQMQGWQLGGVNTNSYYSYIESINKAEVAPSSVTGHCIQRNTVNVQGDSRMMKAMDDGTNGTPRTGTKTEIEAGTLLAYIYVGTYTE